MKKSPVNRFVMSTVLATALLPISAVGAEWSYGGDTGPEHWGDLDPAYHLCKDGFTQSPVDLANAMPDQFATLKFSYKSSALNVVNNGHTIQVNYDDGAGKLFIDDEEYKLLQFHFHSPSEHTEVGYPYPMEVHFVHVNSDGQLAVVGIFIQEGEHNDTIQHIWDAESAVANQSAQISPDGINGKSFFAGNKHEFYAYDGSLTTPPCAEGVRWFVMKDVSHASHEQVQHFLNLFGPTARPVQPLYERAIYENF